MTEKYPRGDPTPIIRSIEKAAKILRARGIYIDLTKEMPLASSADYWLVLNHLHDDLWRRVYASDPKTKNCKVFKIHDDGDATLTCNGVEHVATTEGKLYKEVPKVPTFNEECAEGSNIQRGI